MRDEEISIARNYRDGCVWVSIGDRPRKCISPADARELADGLERFGTLDDVGDEYDDPAEVADGLREAADDVESAGDSGG